MVGPGGRFRGTGHDAHRQTTRPTGRSLLQVEVVSGPRRRHITIVGLSLASITSLLFSGAEFNAALNEAPTTTSKLMTGMAQCDGGDHGVAGGDLRRPTASAPYTTANRTSALPYRA